MHSSILEVHSLSCSLLLWSVSSYSHAFFDANWTWDPTDRRLTIGYCFLLGSSLISWRSKKQIIVAHSNIEAEDRVLIDTISELILLQWLLKDLGMSMSSVTPLYCDNQSIIHIAHIDVFQEWTKHIEIDYHFIRYHLIHGALKLLSVSSQDQYAGILTKSFPKRCFHVLIDNLKLVSHPPWVWRGLLTCNRLVGFRPTLLVLISTHIKALLYMLLLEKYNTIHSVFQTKKISSNWLTKFRDQLLRNSCNK